MKEITHNQNVDPVKYLEIVKSTGAALLRGFIPADIREQVLEEIDLENMRRVEDLTSNVAQQFDTLNFPYPESVPEAVHELGMRIEDLIQPNLPWWQPNDVAIQLYRPATVGIENHRDYKRDIGVVAVATLIGRAKFHIEVDDTGRKVWTTSEVTPGDLTLLRGPGLTGAEEDRPYHRIDPPQSGYRVSIAYRHNVRPDTIHNPQSEAVHENSNH